MPEPAPPGEPGYDPDAWFQHVVYTGLRIARSTGLGLMLFNGLRSRFPSVLGSILGAAATIVGQGVRAAAEWMSGGPDYTPNVDDLPLAPKGFFGPEEVDRIVYLAEYRGAALEGGQEGYDATRINAPEDWSKEAVEDAGEMVHEDDLGDSPDLARLYEWELRLRMNWIGKRF